MSLTGHVENGNIILDDTATLPEGAKVRIEVVVPQEVPERASGTKPTLLGLLRIAGTVKNLPADLAAQHDHYLHGTPKR